MKTANKAGKQKKDPKDAFETMSNINTVLNIFALTSITKVKGNLIVSWSATKTIITLTIFTCINIVFLILKFEYFKEHKNKVHIRFTKILHVSYWLAYVQYITDLYFVYKFGRDITLIYFKLYDRIDNVLGMAYNREIKRRILKTTAFFIGASIFTATFDYIAWITTFEWIGPTLYLIHFLYFIINLTIVLQVSSNVIQIEYRLKTMGDILQDVYFSTEKLPGTLEDIVSEKNWFYNAKKGGKGNVSYLKTLDRGRCFGIFWFSRCYLLLLEQCNYLNTKFGFRVLINFAGLLIDIINILNMAFRIIDEHIVIYTHPYFPVVSSMVRMLNCSASIVCLVYHCQQNYYQYKRVLSIIDFILVDKKIDMEARTTLLEFRNLMLSRPIAFHAMSFFSLNYSLLVTAASFVITYTIITLQL